MRRIFLTCLTLALSVGANAQIIRVKVDDTIQPVTEEYIARAIDQAAAQHADAVLLELRTPGGLVESTRKIIEKIDASPVPVIVYVTPSGGYAASAGFFILESADVAAMSPGTNTGAAHPVIEGGAKIDDVMKSKMENDAAAMMRAFVTKRGRNVDAAESAVRESKSFTDQEALDKHVIDLVAKDEADLLHQLDGRVITRFDGSKATLHLAGKPVIDLSMTLRQRVLDRLMDPNIAFLLFAVGMLAIYAEFNHPGAVVPGVVGVICVVLAIFALNILPTRFAAVAMIVGAFALFIAEAKLQAHGVVALGGAILMTIGGMLLVDGPIPQMRVRFLTAAAVSVPLAAITVFLMKIALRARRGKVTTGAEGMIGQLGVAQTALSPAGKVFVHGEIWNAVASGEVSQGEQVIVRGIKGLELTVEKPRR